MTVQRRHVAAAGLAAAAALGAPRAGRAQSATVVRVLSTTDRVAAQGLIDDFELRHAGHRVDYVELNSAGLYERVSGALRDGRPDADVAWSSAMDLQIKLVNDGAAERHVSRHADALPRWAVWKHEAYGTGVEPVGLLVRRDWAGREGPPRTHAALAERLAADPKGLAGRVTTYDIARAGLGYLLAAQDLMAHPQHWELLRALGRCGARLHTETRAMLEQVARSDAVLAYNVLGSYAQAFARQRPDVEVAYFSDYTLVASRVAFVVRGAPQPQAARRWLDHLLSPDGQRALARSGAQFPIRADVAAGALEQPPVLGTAARPISLGPGLLAHLDTSKREALLRRWRAAFSPS
jgi:iron(III) transport system substrate-binding protein